MFGLAVHSILELEEGDTARRLKADWPYPEVDDDRFEPRIGGEEWLPGLRSDDLR